MGRLSQRLVIPGTRAEKRGERDNGKTFIISEMDAYSGQDWAMRAILALSRSGAQLPASALKSGWPALASFAFSALLGASYADVRPLLDEMLSCVKFAIRPDDKKFPTQAIEPGVNCCVEEVATFLAIYKAVWTLHTGFSLPEHGPTSERTSTPPALPG